MGDDGFSSAPSLALGEPPRLIGRHQECGALDELLDDVRAGRAAALGLVGEAGIGKSALLDYLAARASGIQVRRISGIQVERELAFAALHQLFGPMADRMDRLAAPQRAALRAVFGLETGAVPDRFVIAVAVQQLICDAADEHPLLCIVDDSQWLDRASLQALTFAARRLSGTRAGLVFASRYSTDALRGLPVMPVRGLTPQESGELLDTVLAGCLDPAVRQQIVLEAQGNPLALLELPAGATPAELAGGFAIPGILSLPQRIEASYRRRLDPLPADARHWLLIAAADPVGDPARLWGAAAEAGLGPEAAGAALGTKLVDVGSRVQFRHPLARSAIYRAAEPDRVRHAHHVLAAVTDARVDPDRRAWHRAQAVVGPDEEAARELESSAARARSRGGHAAAAAFLERAAMLTAGRDDRGRRLVAAAQALRDAGALSRALDLLDMLEPGHLTEPVHARAARVRGQIALAQNRTDAVGQLLDAASGLAAYSPQEAREASLEALMAALWAARPGGIDLRRVAATVPSWPAPDGSVVEVMLEGLRARITDGYAAAVPLLSQAVDALVAGAGLSDARLETFRPMILLPLELWDESAWRMLARRQVAISRRKGALALLAAALKFVAVNQIFEGDLTGAARSVAEGRALNASTGETPNTQSLVLVTAWCGQERWTRELVSELRGSYATGRGSAAFVAEYAAAVLDNAAGRFGMALESAWRLFAVDQFPMGPLVVSEVADAASRTGAAAELRAAADWVTVRLEATPSPWVRGVAERVRALLADEPPEPHYRASVEQLGQSRARVELARSHLAYGEWLRRQGRRRDARTNLREAYRLFHGMGAAGFAARADRELQATGYLADQAAAARRTPLTAQEAQIATLARTGMSNPEIGDRLFISKRTVQYHLRKVFQKLDITSRAQLEYAYLPSGDGREGSARLAQPGQRGHGL
jgi:DNA-binding CsgD family transcriptional regulator